MGGVKFTLPMPPIKVVAPSVSGTTKPVTTTAKGNPKRGKSGPQPQATIKHKASGLTAKVTGRQVNITETATGKPFRPLLQLPYDPGVDTPLTASGIGEALKKVSKPESTSTGPSKKKIQRYQQIYYLRHGKKISEASARTGILAARAGKASEFETWLETTGRSDAEKTATRMRKSPAVTAKAVVDASKEAGLLRPGRMKKAKKVATKGARALGPVGGVALLAAGLADPAEAVGMTVDKVGGEGEAFQRKKLGNAGYAKMKREEARYYARKRAKQAKLRKTYFGIK
jgi:hypothetical protein